MSGQVQIIGFAASQDERRGIRRAVSALSASGARFRNWVVGDEPGVACLNATRMAIDLVGKKQPVMLAGPRSLVVPAAGEQISEDAFYAAWIEVLTKHGIAFSLTGASAGTKAPTVRQLDQARGYIGGLVQSSLPAQGRPNICGRPPYGYRVEGGTLVAHAKQQEAVKHAFTLAEKGATLAGIVSSLQGKFGRNSDGTTQFWDRVKLRRIWGNVRLYTHGEYGAGTGQVFQLPSLAFLASGYEKVPYPSLPKRAAAAAADVPSRPGKGKMQAHQAASTPRRRS